MLTIWIIHREAPHRAALARIAGAGDGTVLGGPTDPIFTSATRPNAILLGLSSDFEQELDFVQRFATRLPDTTWILLTPATDQEDSRRLFDTLHATHLPYPPDPLELRRALRSGLRKRKVETLSSRNSRELLRERFSRWFDAVDLPELMRSLDPKLARVPVLIRGERGTGRSLLARYIHAFGGESDDEFIALPGLDIRSPEDLLNRLAPSANFSKPQGAVVWLENVDQLPLQVQRSIADWIEFGLPEGRVGPAQMRWVGGASSETGFETEPGFEPRLAETLSALCLHLPALRERQDDIPQLVTSTALAWGNERAERTRQFSPESLDVLRDYPWPGNLHELESVITRTLSFTGTNPLLPVHIRFPSDSGWLDQLSDASAPAIHTAPATPADDIEPPAQAPSFEEGEVVIVGEPILEPEPIAGAQAHSPVSETTDAASAESEESASQIRRIVNAVAHEVRNPLVSIRTFSELLPERYEDPEFRDRFRELVGQDVARIDGAISRLQNMVDLNTIQSEAVDIAHLLDKLLEEHSAEIRQRRLLVLKELDHRQPQALGDPLLLRDAFSGLLERALAQVTDRGDIYIASKHNGNGGHPSIRILLRYAALPTEQQSAANSSDDLKSILAQTVIQSLGGTFAMDTSDGEECVIVIDLPAPEGP